MDIIFSLLFLLVLCPLIPILRKQITGKKAKNALLLNLVGFGALTLVVMLLPLGMAALAADTTTTVQTATSGLKYIGAAIAVGLSGIGGGIAVAAASTSAIGALSENPATFGKSIIIVGLAEGIALYGMVVGIMILNNK